MTKHSLTGQQLTKINSLTTTVRVVIDNWLSSS